MSNPRWSEAESGGKASPRIKALERRHMSVTIVPTVLWNDPFFLAKRRSRIQHVIFVKIPRCLIAAGVNIGLSDTTISLACPCIGLSAIQEQPLLLAVSSTCVVVVSHRQYDAEWVSRAQSQPTIGKSAMHCKTIDFPKKTNWRIDSYFEVA